MPYLAYEERMRRLKLRAALESPKKRPQPIQVRIGPHPRAKHPHKTPRTWRPVFPFPLITTSQVIERYAVYFASEHTQRSRNSA